MSLIRSIQSAAALPEGWQVTSVVLTPPNAPPGATVVAQPRAGAPHAALQSDLQMLRDNVPGFSLLGQSEPGEALLWVECTFSNLTPTLAGGAEVTVRQIVVMVAEGGNSVALIGSAPNDAAFAAVRGQTLELAQRVAGTA